MIKNSIYFLFVLLLISCNKPRNISSIKVEGQMRDVMKKGDLKGKIATDSLNTEETYGLGPVEFLKGEILLFEGETYVSKVIDSVSHKVAKVSSVKAPFFVYSKHSNLKEIELPNTSYSLESIEAQIDVIYKDYDKPLLVRIDGVFNDLKIHSVNLPSGIKVASPEEAHQGLTQYNFNGISGSLIGFFSRNHKAVFTHHDRFFHAHFISDDRKVLGHIDALNLSSSKVSIKASK